jgi:hypothetical protein
MTDGPHAGSAGSIGGRSRPQMPQRNDCGLVVSNEQSDRLLALLLRLGFTAESIGRSQLLINGSTVDEIHRFALLFGIGVLEVSAGPPADEAPRFDRAFAEGVRPQRSGQPKGSALQW